MALFNLDDELASPSPLPEPIIGGGFLDEQGTMLLAGRAKAGKSFLAIWLGLCLARGEDFLCWPIPRKRNVLYLQMEISDLRVRERARRLGPLGADSRYWVLTDRTFDITRTSLLRRDIEKLGTEVLIIDPFYMLHGSEENSNTEIKRVLTRINSLMEPPLCGIVIVHHFGHNDYIRGASNLLGWPDSILMVKGRSPKNLTVITEGLRNSEPVDDFTISLQDNRFEVVGKAQEHDERAQLILENLPATNGELSKTLGVHSSTVSRQTAEMERRGLIRKVGPLWMVT